MGCTSSKQGRTNRRRSPLLRSYSMPATVRHEHVVSLLSTTLGSFKLRADTETDTNFIEIIDAEELMAGLEDPVTVKKCPPNGENRVVHYITSLRGIRKTYEDCTVVKAILDGYGVKVDERDVSMHGGFKDELSDAVGSVFTGSLLPTVFADGVYLGGVEEVRRMHEDGELGDKLERCEAVGEGRVCEGCGDVRFVPCASCSGSCKVFVDEEMAFQRCGKCNENGLVLCPICY